MDAKMDLHAPDPGLYGCDRELFRQIWSRVSPGPDGPLEVEDGDTSKSLPCQREGDRQSRWRDSQPSDSAESPRHDLALPPLTRGAEEVGLMCFQPSDGDVRQLQSLTLECLTGWNAYRLLAQRTRRRGRELQDFARRKSRHAKRLSAACFLMTGVRYWPLDDLPAVRPVDFFPGLRERFIQEQRLAARLKSLGEAAGDECLRELYLSLAEETLELTHALRLLVERET